MKTAIFLVLVSFATQALCDTPPGFRVSGTSILDCNGNEFVMRGINHAHSWYKQDMEAAISAIARSGANVVRIVLSNGDQYTKDDAESVKKILEVCERNKLIAILEVHDATGYDDLWRLENAANYFLELAPVIKGLEHRVIVNIANEWHGTSESNDWAQGYKTVIPKLRSAGLTHLIIVDTSGWGQYAAAISQKGKEVFDSDYLKNTVFAIHMYEVAAADGATVRKNIDDSLAIGVPVIIGEFSDKQTGKDVAYHDILQYTKERNVGWLAWSWYGNNADTANMDLVTSAAGELTALGREIVDGPDGIRKTAKPATIWNDNESNTPAGFRVSGTSILDRNGNEFVMRGINHAHSWYKQDMEAAISAIARSGANVVRIVLSNGDQYTKDDAESVKKILEVCERNKLIAILEVHDATGYDDLWRLENAANYFLELAPVIKGLEHRVIVNIANEWHGTSESNDWAQGYKTVIPKLRSAGLTHLIIVDTSGWGQYAAAISQKGKEVFDSDYLKNTVFAIHMYEVAAADGATVRKNIDDSLAIGVPVIIGEFSDKQTGKDVAYHDILQYTKERNVGWLAWSWYGNNADTANMDLVTSAAGELTALGREIVDGPNGIRQTAKPATIW